MLGEARGGVGGLLASHGCPGVCCADLGPPDPLTPAGIATLIEVGMKTWRRRGVALNLDLFVADWKS